METSAEKSVLPAGPSEVKVICQNILEQTKIQAAYQPESAQELALDSVKDANDSLNSSWRFFREGIKKELSKQCYPCFSCCKPL